MQCIVVRMLIPVVQYNTRTLQSSDSRRRDCRFDLRHVANTGGQDVWRVQLADLSAWRGYAGDRRIVQRAIACDE
eukprot:COSAG02_NODE_19400_length_884_cov_0.723567_1_plen_74_part_10